MMNIYIYNYDSTTKEFLSKELADEDTAESEIQGIFVPLVPAYATLIEPLQTQENQTNIFNEEQQSWQLISDYRGQYMISSFMEPEKVTTIGDLPVGFVIITNEQIALLERYGKNYFIIANNTLVVNPHYEELEETDRKNNFESLFIETAWGWYRKNPKGYSNAPQSIDIIDKLVEKFGAFTQTIDEMMIFYQKPDFSDPSQCTEEWLIAHQYSHGVCTKEAFDAFYIDFQIRWARNQYKVNN